MADLWQELIPDLLLLEIFKFLDLPGISIASQVCRKWRRIAIDDHLWHGLAKSIWKIEGPLAPGRSCWREEVKRLIYHVPHECSETLHTHSDEVLDVAISHNGKYFCTTSKDATAVLWELGHPSRKIFDANMAEDFNWALCQYSLFNHDDSLLLVCGVMNVDFTQDDYMDRFGYGAIFTMPDRMIQLVCTISLEPATLFGAWLTDRLVLGGRPHETSDEIANIISYKVSNEMMQGGLKGYYLHGIPVFKIESYRYHLMNMLVAHLPGVGVTQYYSVFGNRKEQLSPLDDLNSVGRRRNSSNNSVHSSRNSPASRADSQDQSSKSSFSDVDEDVDECDGKTTQCCDSHRTNVCKCNSDSQISQDYGFDKEQDFVGNEPGCSYRSCDTTYSSEEESNESKRQRIDDISESHHCSEKNSRISELDSSKNATCSKEIDEERTDETCSNADSDASILEPELSKNVSEDSMSSDLDRDCEIGNIYERYQHNTFCDKHYVIFVTGVHDSIAVHEVPEQVLMEIERLGDETDLEQPVERLIKDPDHLFVYKDCYITGATLSKDQRYVYLNYRELDKKNPANHPGRHEEDVDIRYKVFTEDLKIGCIDLQTMCKMENVVYDGHVGYSAYPAWFICLDASDDFVGSCSEDNCSYIWDRQYQVLLSVLCHDSKSKYDENFTGTMVTNGIAFSPIDQETCITVCDDHVIKIWRSRNRMKELKMQEEKNTTPGFYYN